MKSFSLKKPEPKKTITSLASDKPASTVIHTISSSGALNPSEVSKPTTPTEPLVIPCINPIPAPIPQATIIPIIPSTPGLHIPAKISDPQISDRPSVLLGLKRPAEAEAVAEFSDSEDLAWGLLRGMGWEGDAESEISRFRK